MQEKEEQISRRDFLKLSGATAGLFTLGKSLRSKESQPYPDSPIRFRFGDHLLTPKDITPEDSLILGETDLNSLAVWHAKEDNVREYFDKQPNLQDITKTFTQASISSSSYDLKDHVEALIQIRRNGLSLVVTDAHHWETVPFEIVDHKLFNSYKDATRRFILGGIGFAVIALSYEFYRAKNRRENEALYDLKANVSRTQAHKESRKDIALTIAGISAAVGLAATTTYFFRDEIANSAAKVEPLPKALLRVYEALGSLGDEEKRQLFRLIDIRNLSMALNTHLVQETLRQTPNLRLNLLNKSNQDKLNFLFFAGLAHAKAKDEYYKGLYYLTQALSEHAQKTISFSSEQIDKSQKKEEARLALDDWIVLTSAYSYPIPLYASSKQFIYGPRRDLPDSARAILWKELLNKFYQEPENSTLKKMVQRLAGEDFVFQHWAMIRGDPQKPYFISAIEELKYLRRRALDTLAPSSYYPLPSPINIPSYLKPPPESLQKKYNLLFSEGIPHILEA